MLRKLQKLNEGFTIIEVLIVLAIAGLIILIVLLAVPALQRNQRNTSRKNDITRIAGAVTNFVANRNGALPASTADATTILTDAGQLGQYSLTGASPIGTAASNKLSILALSSGTSAPLATNAGDEVQIVTGAICDSATPGQVTTTGASTRSISIQYTIETGTAGTAQALCQNT